MDRTFKSEKEKSRNEGAVDEVDNVVVRRSGRIYGRSADTSASTGISGIEILESPGGHEDSAYHTFPHSSSSPHSFSKSSSMTSSGRFPSEESFRPMSPASSTGSASKKSHSTLIRIQLGDDKKVSHEWYSQFTHHNQAFNSPLANRVANTSSQFEYDSHIAHMRGKFRSKLKFILLLFISKLLI